MSPTWWNWTVYLNKKETNKVALGATLAALISPSIPVYGAIMALGAGVVSAVAQYAQGNGHCLKLVAFLGGAATPLSYGGTEAGGYCR